MDITKMEEWVMAQLPNVLLIALKVIVAILVLWIGMKLIGWVVKVFKKYLNKVGADKGVASFLSSFVKYSLTAVLIFIILSKFGLDTGSIVALLGSAGLTIGLAIQGSLSNFAGGVLILLIKPFSVGDYILDKGSGMEGVVTDISMFYTKLTTPDNRVILIPNGGLANSTIVNVTKMDKRRLDLTVGVAYEENLAKVKEILQKIVEEETAVLKDEETNVFVSELSDSSVDMGIRVWVSTGDYWATKWRMTEKIKNQFDEQNISIPFPQLDVQIKK